jgi:hypothetical protein
MDAPFADPVGLAPERWAALHGVTALAAYLQRSVRDASSRRALPELLELVSDPARRAELTATAARRPKNEPPYRPASAIDDLGAYRSPARWAARYLWATTERALAPLAPLVPSAWLKRAVAVVDEPWLLDHARRQLLTPAEQVAVADAFLTEPRSAARDDHERYAAAMRAEAETPEEWAARFAHTLLFGTLFDVRYADPVTDRWMARVWDLIRSGWALSLLRQQYLSVEEWAAIEVRNHEEY